MNTQGAPVAATDQQGEIKWRQEYANFGYHTESTGQINDLNETSFGLAGHVEDQYDDLLLVYMQARYYDPLMGRFLSIDAAGFDEANPQSFNRYSYANNNPHRYVDPDGNIIFLAPFAYKFTTFVAKEVAIAVVSHYVPAVQYLCTKSLVKEGVEATGKLFVRKKSAGQLGQQGEAIASAITGVGKNTKKFPVNGRNRIPDQVNGPKHLTEVKNVEKQSFTQQLKDYVDLVGGDGGGGRVDVFVRGNTKISGPLQ